MKKILINCFVMTALAILWMGCKRDNDYIISTPSDFIANFDLRKLYRGSDVTLTKENMRAATSLKGQVISDHSGNNMPAGLLVVQNLRATGNGIDSLRGIAINIGADAAKYVPGDSVHVKIEGGVLKRVDGILEITGIAGANVTKISSGRKLILNRGFVNLIQSQPDKYECTFLNIWKGTYNPSLASSDVFAGVKTLNDGTGDITLFTQNNAVFANLKPPYSADYKGIVFNSVQGDKLVPRFCIRTIDDVFTLSATPDVPEVIITGFINDPQGSDTNAEYIQCRATKDINFADTKFTIVTNNNAGTTVPLGVPAEGWATGSGKTYKLELTAGTVSKGEFFYVGASNKLINGAGSTSIAASKWIRSAAYNTNSPYFNASNTARGSSTTNLLANSGNAFGIAVFRGLAVDKNTVPIDVVFVHNGGSLYDAGSQTGYRIGNTDVYDVIDHNTNKAQPFFLSGSNTQKFTYQPNAGASDGSGQGYWFALGGVFDTTLGKWVKARSHIHIKLSSTSVISEIETTNATELK